LELGQSVLEQTRTGGGKVKHWGRAALDNVSRRIPFHLGLDRGWDHALRAILRAQQRDMVNAIEQGNDGPHGARILDGGKRRI
jgi:hypothetical protein